MPARAGEEAALEERRKMSSWAGPRQQEKDLRSGGRSSHHPGLYPGSNAGHEGHKTREKGAAKNTWSSRGLEGLQVQELLWVLAGALRLPPYCPVLPGLWKALWVPLRGELHREAEPWWLVRGAIWLGTPSSPAPLGAQRPTHGSPVTSHPSSWMEDDANKFQLGLSAHVQR